MHWVGRVMYQELPLLALQQSSVCCCSLRSICPSVVAYCPSHRYHLYLRHSFNIYLAARLAGIEVAVFTIYVLAFVTFFIVLLAMGCVRRKAYIHTLEDNAQWAVLASWRSVDLYQVDRIRLCGTSGGVIERCIKTASQGYAVSAVVNYLLGFLMLMRS